MTWFIYALTAMIVQGILVFFVKLLSSQFNSLILLMFQYLGALILATVYVIKNKIKMKLTKKDAILIFASAFLVSTGLSFYYLAIKQAPISIASPLQSVGVLIIQSIFGFMILKEKATKKTIIGILCALISIMFLTI